MITISPTIAKLLVQDFCTQVIEFNDIPDHFNASNNYVIIINELTGESFIIETHQEARFYDSPLIHQYTSVPVIHYLRVCAGFLKH